MLKLKLINNKNKAYILFYTLVMLPIMLIGLALASDASRIIMISHKAGSVADNVAMAGATGVDSTNEQLDTDPNGKAATFATITFQQAVKVRMIPSDVNPSLSISDLSPNNITVKVSYTVKNLLIFGFFNKNTSSISGVATRSAGPCISTPTLSCKYLN